MCLNGQVMRMCPFWTSNTAYVAFFGQKKRFYKCYYNNQLLKKLKQLEIQHFRSIDQLFKFL